MFLLGSTTSTAQDDIRVTGDCKLIPYKNNHCPADSQAHHVVAGRSLKGQLAYGDGLTLCLKGNAFPRTLLTGHAVAQSGYDLGARGAAAKNPDGMLSLGTAENIGAIAAAAGAKADGKNCNPAAFKCSSAHIISSTGCLLTPGSSRKLAEGCRRMWSWSIQSACALDRERFALLCYEDDVAYDDPQRIQTIRLVRAHSITKTVDLRGEYVRICQVEDAKAEVAVLSSEGAIELIDFAGARIATEHIGTGGQPVNPYGHLTTIRQIAGHLYACGMGGQVHERMAPNDWRLISRDLCSENIYERWFSNIDGLSVSYLLAAGLAGALYFYDGRSWARMETSTEAPLGEMAFLDNRDVYAAGAQSTLLRGNPQSGFKKINLSARDLTLYTICRYQNRIFLGTDRGIFELDVPSQALLPVDIGTHDGEIILLQATGDVMWAFGSKFIRRYNGAVWEIFDQIP